MKINFTNALFTKTIYCSLLSSGVLMSHNLWANDDPETAKKKKNEATAAARTSLNNKSVKIYPDAFKKEMHVLVREKTEITFVVLDTDGTLMLNRKLKPNEHFKVTGLEKGNYSYHVFDGDEEKATGKFEIR
jgi:gluconate kinase